MKKIYLLALPLLILMACNSNEPPFSPEEESAIKNGSDVEYVKPILYETENMKWFTEYNYVQNIYTTKMTHGIVQYKVKSDFVLSDEIAVTKIVKEQDGKFELIDVSESKQENLSQYKTEILDIKVSKEGNVDISLTSGYYLEYYEYCYYHIYLSNSDKTIGTKIIINDILDGYVSGMSHIDLDLSGVEYPNQRDYDPISGYYKGSVYTIWLPSDECEVELSADKIYDISQISLMVGSSEEYTTLYSNQMCQNYLKPTYSITCSCGEFVYNGPVVENGQIPTGKSTLKCKILKNEGKEERTVIVHLNGAAWFAAIKFVQSAK